MKETLYIPRRLSSTDQIYTETKLLEASNYIVVLAEPGAGKTALMESLAKQLGTVVVTANFFSYVEASDVNNPIVIDAFDELAKVEKTGIHKLLANARKACPTHVIISSRSSEWGSAATNVFKDFLGHPPLEVKLYAFNEIEQRSIFEYYAHDEDFNAFQAEVARFDLSMLLPNPQFLKLFADAYIESERHFTDKRQIFAKAVEHLSKEANVNIANVNPALSSAQKVDLSSEVFAKLLLSGTEGVSVSEATESRLYPLLASVFDDNTTAGGILATRLFKPGDNIDQHRPVHKIVAEYCAANYLTKRITDAMDPLTLSMCQPIIAPNAVVRDELRGLLGWMAALGNKPIEEMAIKLDAYAVLANGDPSQLTQSSKRLLINELKDMEAKDPYFRKRDFWRNFSMSGFFTKEVIVEIKPLLVVGNDGHLRDLILELLAGKPEIEWLTAELRLLTLASNENQNTRFLANSCLLSLKNYDHSADFNVLIDEASDTSLDLVANRIETLGPATFEKSYLANFIRVCANLYPDNQADVDSARGERYFIKHFIACLPLDIMEWLMDDFTNKLGCKCGKDIYECYCRNGISKLVGLMLDRYFELARPPYDPIKIWHWVENLHFQNGKDADQSKAVKVLQQDNHLRQSIIAHVFGKLTDSEQIDEIKEQHFDFYSHSGLLFCTDDYKFIVDLAFESDNPSLWAFFIARHQYYGNKENLGPNSLRQHMRQQAMEKAAFMRVWVKCNNVAEQSYKERKKRRYKHNCKMNRLQKRQDDARIANISYIQANRSIVEGGQDFDFLRAFADSILFEPDKIKQKFGDEALVRNAVGNCLDFIKSYVLDLFELAELQCSSKSSYVVRIIYAACLEILRIKGHLEGVDFRQLKVLRIGLRANYPAVSKQQNNELKGEVDRLIFPDIASIEDFIRQYLEPQLAVTECIHLELDLLRTDETFSPLRSRLSIEWLQRFDELALMHLATLFQIAAQYGDRKALQAIIAQRCSEFIAQWPEPTDSQEVEQKRTFWFIRSWYFLNDAPAIYWNWLKADKNTALALYHRSEEFDGSGYWPQLTSTKVEAILEAFIDKWPKMYLPNSWGTGSAVEENAYRFLTKVIWRINSDVPDDAIPVLNRLLSDSCFIDLHKDLQSIHTGQVKNKALRDFTPPTPDDIVNILDRNSVVTVEGLRQLLLQELQHFQQAINGGEFNSADRFYEQGTRLNEVCATEIIAERLNLRLEPQNIEVVPERQLKNANRCDISATKMVGGKKRMLVVEAKGQWHRELYAAASEQLNKRYAIHPDAEQQGIFLVIWFGADEKVAGRKHHGIDSAQLLKSHIEAKVPTELTGLIDVFVLDVSRSQ